MYVTLTPKGEALISEVFPAFNQHEKAFVSGLTTEEVETLVHLLRKVILSNSEAG